MTTHVQAFEIGCQPSPSVPAETLLADGWRTYLLFFAVSNSVGASGYLDDLGVAVLACENCAMSKFGYPNDEGLAEHPLYEHGVSQAASSVFEVVESAWVQEVLEQKLASARRIWGRRGMDWGWAEKDSLRHFIVTLKEKTFECLASSIQVERFCGSYDEAFSHVIGELNKD